MVVYEKCEMKKNSRKNNKYSYGEQWSKSRSEELHQESWNENFLELIVSKKQQTPINTCSEKSNPGPNEAGRAIARSSGGGAFCFR